MLEFGIGTSLDPTDSPRRSHGAFHGAVANRIAIDLLTTKNDSVTTVYIDTVEPQLPESTRDSVLIIIVNSLLTTMLIFGIAHKVSKSLGPTRQVGSSTLTGGRTGVGQNVPKKRGLQQQNQPQGRSGSSRNQSSFSRMLDMGGAPSGATDQSKVFRPPNVSKNSKLQAVAFDFEILTRSLQDAKPPSPSSGQSSSPSSERTSASSTTSSVLVTVTPDLTQIGEIASLLKVSVDMGSTTTTTTTGEKSEPKPKSTSSSSSSSSTTTTTSSHQDIRAKYASKIAGGIHGIELAKSQVEDTLKGGDASSHLAARQMAIKNSPTDGVSSTNKWMALSGTGRLLSYLTHRGIKIALLPNIRLKDLERKETEFQYMSDFNKQLKDIIIDTVVRYDDDSDGGTKGIESMLKQGVMEELDIHPNKILVVSDKDEYLSIAKGLGMITCRLRPKNARRGNVTAIYNTEDVESVQEVVNEISGISFNAVLNR